MELTIGIGLVVVGLTLYTVGIRRFTTLYEQRFAGQPPRNWLRHSVQDADAERFRRLAALGGALNLMGVILLVSSSVR